MKTNRLLAYFFGIGMAGGLLACSNQADIASAPTYRLVKATSYKTAGRSVEIDTTIFTYDAMGYLTGYASHGADPKAIRRGTVTYSGIGRVNYIDEVLPNGGINDVRGKVVGYRAVYNYDARGNVEQVLVSAAINNFESLARQDNYVFTYDDEGNPIKRQYTRVNTNYYDTYEYTFQKGNAVSARYLSTALTNAIDYSYQYDESPNAYKGIFKLVPAVDCYNKNNQISGLTPSYDSRGLLIRTTAPGSAGDNITTYSYELAKTP